MRNQTYIAFPPPPTARPRVPMCATLLALASTAASASDVLIAPSEQTILGFVRKVVVAKIAAMTGWRPVWQGVTNFLMHHGS